MSDNTRFELHQQIGELLDQLTGAHLAVVASIIRRRLPDATDISVRIAVCCTEVHAGSYAQVDLLAIHQGENTLWHTDDPDRPITAGVWTQEVEHELASALAYGFHLVNQWRPLPDERGIWDIVLPSTPQ